MKTGMRLCPWTEARRWLGAVALGLLCAVPASAGELRGRVLSDHRGLSGAVVSALPFETTLEGARREARGTAAPAPLAQTTTGADGGFVVTLAATAPDVQLRVEGAGFQILRLASVFDGTDSTDVGDVSLPRSASLGGRVTDGRGAAVAGADVTLEPGAPVGAAGEVVPEARTAKTGSDGSFRLDGAGSAGNRLRVQMKGFAAASLAGLRAGTLAAPIILKPAVGVSGSVRRQDGRSPAAGALVRFEGAGSSRWVEAAADGTFRLADVPATAGRLVADGGALGRVESPVTPSEGMAPSVLVLGPTTRLAGRVVDAKTLAPVPRARVEARGRGRTSTSRSGPDGRYAFDSLAPGTYDVAADEPRFVPYERRRVRVAAGTAKAVDLPLTLGVTLSGRVVDERGQGVAGAVGRLSAPAAGGFGPRARGRGTGGDASFRTGADGTFRASRLPSGTNERLTLSHPQFEPRVVAGLSLPPGATRTGLNVVLRRGLEIGGTVRDTDGRAVEGAEIEIRPSASERRGGARFGFDPGAFDRDRMRVTSEANGAFRVAGLEPGAYSVQTRRDGFADATIDPVRVEAGTPTPPVDVWMLPGATIGGFVRRPDGSGAKGFVVRSRAEEGEARPFGAGPSEATGEDGAFSISGLRAGQTYSVSVLGRGGVATQRDGIQAPALDLEILVPGAGRITGHVVDAQTQKPVTVFTATYASDGGPGGFGPGGGGRARGGAPRGARRPDDEDATDDTSPDGTFSIDGVPPGTWAVNVDADGYERARVGGVVVKENEATPDVTVKVTRGRVLSGRTLDALTGRPVPGVSVTASNAGGGGPGGGGGNGLAYALTDVDGRFDLAGLSLGTYRLQTQHPDYAEASQIVDMQQPVATTEIRLSSGGTLAGLVVADSGAPLPGATVSMQAGAGGGRFGGGGPGSTTISDDAGAFHFDRLAAGLYTLSGSLGARASAPLEVALAAGASRGDIRLALGGGTTVRGQVSGLGNDLRGTVNVTATGPDSYFAGVRPTVDGAFTLSGVPSGTIHLRATAGTPTAGIRTASTDVTIADGDTDAEADIAFTAGDSLSGTVTRGGTPEPSVTVAAAPAGQGLAASARTDATGAYTLSGLSDGDYNVTASPARGAAQRKTLHVAGDQNLDFALPLSALAGTVVEAGSGLPLSGADVSADAAEGGPRSGARSTTDSNGHFDIEGLEPQSYTLTSRLSGYAYDTRTVDASADGSGALTIELKRGDGLGVRALDGTFGVPLRALIAEVRDNANLAVFTGRVSLDSDGRGEIPSLRPGVYAIRLGAPGYAPVRLGVTIPSPTVEVDLLPGGTVDIRVGPTTLARAPQAQLLDGSGIPFPAGPFSGNGSFALSTADRLIQHVTPGSYTLVVAGGPTDPVAVTEGGTAVVDLP